MITTRCWLAFIGYFLVQGHQNKIIDKYLRRNNVGVDGILNLNLADKSILQCSTECTMMGTACQSVVSKNHRCYVYSQALDSSQLVQQEGSTYLEKEYGIDCHDLSNGIQYIKPATAGGSVYEVYCEDGGTVLSVRPNNPEHNWQRTWVEYSNGFGCLNDKLTEMYWMGNKLIHHITYQGNYGLRMDLMNYNGVYYTAYYKYFRVAAEGEKFKLEAFSGYQGNLTMDGDPDYIEGMEFSTPDQDNDESGSAHCAQKHGGGFWFKNCAKINVNGFVEGQNYCMNYGAPEYNGNLYCAKHSGITGSNGYSDDNVILSSKLRLFRDV